MNEQFVSHETFLLAIEEGYANELPDAIPTQSLLQKFIREQRGVHIEILLSSDPPFNTFDFRIMKLGQYFTLSLGIEDVSFNTYEEALEKALFKSLNII